MFILIEQEIIKKKCIKKIPVGKIEHDGEHECQTEVHKCGFICRQCERLCELDYGHNDQHYCLHGHIKNSLIQIGKKTIQEYLNDISFQLLNNTNYLDYLQHNFDPNFADYISFCFEKITDIDEQKGICT